METLPQVERARALMNEAMAWSVMKWLREKKRVRATADEANAALDQLRQRIQDQWPNELRSEYTSMLSTKRSLAGRKQEPNQGTNGSFTPALKNVKEADDDACAARMDAEKTFDDAEKQLSTRLAREGCKKAIFSWDLHEKAIKRAGALVQSR